MNLVTDWKRGKEVWSEHILICWAWQPMKEPALSSETPQQPKEATHLSLIRIGFSLTRSKPCFSEVIGEVEGSMLQSILPRP